MKLGLCSVVFIVLLVLKLCELATIPWLWVFMPLIVIAGWWVFLLMLFMGFFIYKVAKEFG